MKFDPRSWAIRTRGIVGAVVFATICAAIVGLRPAEEHGTAAVNVDMLVSESGPIELYLNSNFTSPLRLSAVAGTRHVYHFAPIPRHITAIRLDPIAATSARIVIYGITISSGDRTVRRFSPADLQGWEFSSVSRSIGDPAGLALTSTTNDPWLVHSEAIDTSEEPNIINRWARPLVWLIVVALGLAAYVVAGAPTPSSSIFGLVNRPLFLLVLVIVGFASVVWIQAAHRNSEASIYVDMLVGRGEQVELYLNSSEEPLRETVAPNQRHTYRFDRPPSHVTKIRLDPTAAVGTKVVLYSIRVVIGDRTVTQFASAELRGWHASGLRPATGSTDVLEFETTNTDPQLSAPVALDLPNPARVLTEAGAALAGPDSIILLAMCAFLSMVVAGVTGADGFREFLLVAFLLLSVHPLLTAVHMNGSPPPVHSAVGMSAYIGYPKSGDYEFSYLLFAVISVSAFACWRWLKPRRPVDPEPKQPSRQLERAWIGHALVIVGLLLYFVPDLRTAMVQLKSISYAPLGWDDTNGFIWRYLVESGYRPFRDFWYPYAGFYIQLLPFPRGPLIGAGFVVLPLVFLYFGLYYVTGRRYAQSVVAFLLVLLPILMGQLQGASRYLLAVDVSLLYLAVVSTNRVNRGLQVLLGTCTALATFCEPTQVAYAGVGIAIDVLVLACSQSEPFRTVPGDLWLAIKRRAMAAGLPIAAGIVLPLGFYAMNGMLPGLWEFEASLRDQAAYGAFPARVADWVRPILTPDAIFFVLYLLAAVAIYRLLRRIRRLDALTLALLVVCGIGLLCMQKQIMRPHSIAQLRLFPYIALVLYGVTMWCERAPSCRAAIAVFAGGALAIAWSSALIPARVLAAAPAIVGDFDVLLNHHADLRQIHSTRFDGSRFSAFDEQNAVTRFIEQRSPTGSRSSIYVLGDDSLFYILLKQVPPYVTNSYNMSPIYEQVRTLEWLNRVRPRFVVWSPGNAAYDSTPHVVRLPLVYDYVVRHYRLENRIGPYHVLTALEPAQAPDFAYWQQTLGGEDLGFIPGLARLSDFEACGNGPCSPVIVAKRVANSGASDGKVGLEIRSGSREVSVTFQLSPDQDSYVIPMRRLWFSYWLEKAPIEVVSLDSRLQVEVQRRVVTDSLLY